VIGSLTRRNAVGAFLASIATTLFGGAHEDADMKNEIARFVARHWPR